MMIVPSLDLIHTEGKIVLFSAIYLETFSHIFRPPLQHLTFFMMTVLSLDLIQDEEHVLFPAMYVGKRSLQLNRPLVNVVMMWGHSR